MPILKAKPTGDKNPFLNKLDSLLHEAEGIKSYITGYGDPKQFKGKSHGKTEDKGHLPVLRQGMRVIEYEGMKFLAAPPEGGTSIVYGKDFDVAGLLLDKQFMEHQEESKVAGIPSKAVQTAAQSLYTPEELQADNQRVDNLLNELRKDPHSVEIQKEIKQLGLAVLPKLLQAYSSAAPEPPPVEKPKEEGPKIGTATKSQDLPAVVGKFLIRISSKLSENDQNDLILMQIIDDLHSSPTKESEFKKIIDRVASSEKLRALTSSDEIKNIKQAYNTFIASQPKPEEKKAAPTSQNVSAFLKHLKSLKTEAVEDDYRKVLRSIIRSFTGINGILKMYEKFLEDTPEKEKYDAKVMEYNEAIRTAENEYSAEQTALSGSGKTTQVADAKYQKKREILQGKLVVDLIKIFEDATKSHAITSDPSKKEKYSKMKKIVLDFALPLLASKSKALNFKVARKEEPKPPEAKFKPTTISHSTDAWIMQLVMDGRLPPEFKDITPEERRKRILDLLNGPDGLDWIEKLPGSIVTELFGGGSLSSDREIPWIFGPGFAPVDEAKKPKKESDEDKVIKQRMSTPFESNGVEEKTTEEWIKTIMDVSKAQVVIDKERIPEDVLEKTFTVNGTTDIYTDPLTNKPLTRTEAEAYTKSGKNFNTIKSDVDEKGNKIPFIGTCQGALDYVIRKAQLSSMIYGGAVRVSTEKGIIDLLHTRHEVGKYIPEYARDLPDPGAIIGYVLKFPKVDEKSWTRIQQQFDVETDIYRKAGFVEPSPIFLRFQDYPEGAKGVDAMLRILKSTLDDMGGWEFEVVPTSSPAPGGLSKIPIASGEGPIDKPKAIKKPAIRKSASKRPLSLAKFTTGGKIGFTPTVGKTTATTGGIKSILSRTEPEKSTTPTKPTAPAPTPKGDYTRVTAIPMPRVEPRSGVPRGEEEEEF